METQNLNLNEKIEDFVNKFVEYHKDIVYEFAKVKQWDFDKAYEEAKREIKEFIEDYLREDEINNLDEVRDLEEYILDYLWDSYLSIEVENIDLSKNELKFNILTAFGGPTIWLPLVWDLNSCVIDFDYEELDYALNWYYGQKTLRDFVNFKDVLFIYLDDMTLKEVISYKVKEEFQNIDNLI